MVCTMHIYVIDKHLSKKQKFIQSKIHFTQQSVKFVCVVYNNRETGFVTLIMNLIDKPLKQIN